MSRSDRRTQLAEKMFFILEDKGLRAFVKTANAALAVNAYGDNEDKAKFVGEVCEIVLLGLTQYYIKKNKLKALPLQSVVLKNLEKLDSPFRTELDFVLVTPAFILTTECKSYRGKLSIGGEGIMVTRNRDVNLWSQSLTHVAHLRKYARHFVIPKRGVTSIPVVANVFLFSDSKVDDFRTRDKQQQLPIVTISTLFAYYDHLSASIKREVFDYEKACRVLQKCADSEKLHQQHAHFLGYIPD